MQIDAWVYLIPFAGAIGLLVAYLLTRSIFRKDTGTPEMEAIGDAIREGAMAYLARQYKTIAIISVILGIVIAIGIRLGSGVAFLLGAFFSALSGYIGMYVSVKTNIRTASAARRNLERGPSDLLPWRCGLWYRRRHPEPTRCGRRVLPVLDLHGSDP